MKKVFFILCLLLFVPTNILAQKVIEMENANGVYKISCSVNGAKMKMIFDTGASNVSLSMAIANYLYENDYINKDDIVGVGQTYIADGSIKDNVIINIRDIEISGLHLKNVRATVIDGQNVPLLLGLSAIQKLGSITIDGNILIINDEKSDLTGEDVMKMEDEFEKYIDNGSYYSAIEVLTHLENTVGLSSYGYYQLTYCYIFTDDMKNLISACKRWLNLKEVSQEHLSICYDRLYTGYFTIKDYKEAIKWAEKKLLLSEKDLYALSSTYFDIASGYFFLNNYGETKRYGLKAIVTKFGELNKDIVDVLRGEVKDEKLGWYFYSMGFYSKCLESRDKARVWFVYGAMTGDKSSVNECHAQNIDYEKEAKRLLRYLKKNQVVN